jgi:hypothetical protein
MSYKITDFSYKQAKKLGVQIRPSVYKNKKIDVFKDDVKIASIGDINYLDYPTYIETKGKKYADERRKLYKIRHKNDINVKNSNGFFSSRLLW